MSAFLDAMESWARSISSGERGVTVTFTRGPTDRNKTAASVALESPTVLGAASVWSSGEVEVQILKIEDGQLILQVSDVLAVPGDIHGVLDRALESIHAAA